MDGETEGGTETDADSSAGAGLGVGQLRPCRTTSRVRIIRTDNPGRNCVSTWELRAVISRTQADV